MWLIDLLREFGATTVDFFIVFMGFVAVGYQIIIKRIHRKEIDEHKEDIEKLDIRYQLLNTNFTRACDQLYAITGSRIIKGHRSGDVETVNPLFDESPEDCKIGL